ncbi:MAG: hypothetical protein ACOC2E_03030 [Bacteroidota bacterium]
MNNEFEINDLFAFAIPGYTQELYIGEISLREKENPDAGYFGKIFLDKQDTYILIMGKNRYEIESNAMFLAAYTLNYLMNDLYQARTFKPAEGLPAPLN